jgi:hypothetical protein
MRRVARERFNDFALRSSKRLRLARYEQFIDGICGAICSAWSRWQSQAVLSGVRVEDKVASGGKLLGPAWAPLILERAPAGSPWARQHSQVVARTLGDAWSVYVASMWVPSLEWYPSLAEGTADAPPVANQPVPLEALGQVVAGLDKMSLVSRMALALGRPLEGLEAEMYECVMEAFVQSFRRWRAGTRVTDVMASGSGPAVMRPGGFR